MEGDFIKIINETYKLLDFFPDGDPLKNKAKEKSLAVLEGLTLVSSTQGWVSLKTCLSPEREKSAVKLLEDIEILENYLKLGKYHGWIDGISFLILMKEYGRIKDKIIQLKGVGFGFQKKFIGLSSKIEPKSPTSADIGRLDLENKSLPSLEATERQNPPSHPPTSKTSADAKDLADKSDGHGKASARQGKILQMLSEKEKIQVADIIKEIPNITKRTIRRDLDDLLKKNIIARIGEWNQVFYQIVRT